MLGLSLVASIHLVVSADGDLCRYIRAYWIITPLPSVFATLPLLLNLVLFSAFLILCMVLRTLCVCSDDGLSGNVLSSNQCNSIFLVASIF